MSFLDIFHRHTECHCGFDKHLSRLQAKTGKRLGKIGAAIMIAHFLFHVIECLVLPAILVGFGSHVTQEDALAADEETIINDASNGSDGTRHDSILDWNFYDAWEILDLERSSNLLLDL